MRINNIEQLQELNKIIPKGREPSEYQFGDFIKNFTYRCKKHNIDFNNCILYVTNIFLSEKTNKYKNTKPLKCIVKYGSRFDEEIDGFCLVMLNSDIWDDHYRYSHIERIDDILKTGKAIRRGSIDVEVNFPNLALFTTYSEANNYITEYKSKYNLKKYTEKLSRINSDIEILMKEKQRLEELIKNNK